MDLLNNEKTYKKLIYKMLKIYHKPAPLQTTNVLLIFSKPNAAARLETAIRIVLQSETENNFAISVNSFMLSFLLLRNY